MPNEEISNIMEVVTVFLPDHIQRYVEERIRAGDYNSVSEYMCDLIYDDQKRQAEARLETLLLRGLDSPASQWTKDDVDYIKSVTRQRLRESER